MKVDQESLGYINKVVSTARLFGIDGIIIEPGRVRAVDEDSSVLILHTNKVPEMPFGSIGLNRTDLFSTRYEVAAGVENFSMEATIEGPDGATYARALTMKSKGIKIDYRCANPATIRAPKSLNGDAPKYQGTMYANIVKYLSKAASAMESDEVLIVGDENGVNIEVTDINGDKLSYQCSDAPTYIGDGEDPGVKFAHRYPTKLIQTLFKNNIEGRYIISTRGMIRVAINGLDVSVLPRS